MLECNDLDAVSPNHRAVCGDLAIRWICVVLLALSVVASRLFAEVPYGELQAIRKVELLGGRYTTDDTLPGEPVVSVDFSQRHRDSPNKQFNNRRFSEKYFGLLEAFPHLSTLNLANSDTTEIGAEKLKRLKQLKALYLVDTKINDAGMKHLAALTELESLDLSMCRQITDQGIKEIGELKTLTDLNLVRTKLTDTGLRELKGLTRLARLSISGTRITDQGVRELRDLKSLTFLALSNTQVTDVGLKQLSELENLSDLALARTDTTDVGLKELVRLEKLENLNLVGCKGVSDVGAKELGTLRSLKKLNLGGTRISNIGLKELQSLTNLTRLYLHGTKVTSTGTEQLGKALPNLEISQ